MRDEAFVDRDEVVAAMAVERGAPVAHTHPHGRAVARRWQRLAGGHVRGRQSPDPPQCVEDDVALQLDLDLGCDVLPPATPATGADVRTRWGHSPLGRLDDLDDYGARIVRVLVEHLGLDELVRQRTVDEHDSAVVVSGERRAARGHRGGPQPEGGGHRRSVRLAA